MIISGKDTAKVSKSGVDMWLYDLARATDQAALVYQETTGGHDEEIRHSRCTYIYYIVEGRGEWIIEDEVFPVSSRDVVVVPAGKRFYYRGTLKQLCITVPPWEPTGEQILRQVSTIGG